MADKFKGYKGEAKKLLEQKNIGVWDIIRVTTNKTTLEGIILPRAEYAAPNYIEIKLDNNYNVGINISDISKIEKIGEREAKYKIPEKKFDMKKNLPNVRLLGTGGTVASRLDYTTGAVIPSFTPGELFSVVPELAEICNLECESVFVIFSFGTSGRVSIRATITNEINAFRMLIPRSLGSDGTWRLCSKSHP